MGKHGSFFYGYVIVMAAFALQALGWGIFNSFGVFFTPLMEEFQWQRAAIALAFSGGLLVNGIFAIAMGGFNDRTGPRLIMSICGLILGVGFLCLSRLQSLWQFYFFFCVLVGIGVSGTDVVLLSTTARWFIQKRGMMSGILKVGTGFGMLLFPLIITSLISNFGWRTAFFYLGWLIVVVFTFLAQFLVRDPQQKGMQPDNAHQKLNSHVRTEETGLSLQKAFSTRQFWTICLCFFLVLFCAATILVHIVPYIISRGYSPEFAAGIASTIGGMSILGRFTIGWAGDKAGNKTTLTCCFCSLLFGLGCLFAARQQWFFVVFALFHGFAHGGFFSVISPIVAEYFGTVAHGAILGFVIFSSTIGGAVGPVLGGGIVDMTGSYFYVFSTVVGMGFLGLLSTLTLHPIPFLPINRQPSGT